MRIYWYAPFNNAHELELAGELPRAGDAVTLQSLRSRRGVDLSITHQTITLVRDLPDTAGDDGGPRTRGRRARIAVSRVAHRHRYLQRTEFDVVHVHTYNPYVDPVALRLTPRRRGVPLVLSIHNVRPHDSSVPSLVERRALRLGYAAADRVIVAHHHLKRELEAEIGIDGSRVDVVPIPVPTIPLSDEVPPPGRYLFFGTLRRNKGVEIALAAMSRIGDSDISLHFAGRGLEDLERKVLEAAGRDRRITAEIGYIPPDRRDHLFRQSSAILLPYVQFSAQSGVLGDAYAYRRPVIATDLGALGEDVRASETGLLVEPGDASGLAAAMVTMATDDAMALRCRDAASVVATQRSIPRIAAQLRGLYERG